MKSNENLNLKIVNPEQVRSRRYHNLYKVRYNEELLEDTDILRHILIETIVAYKPYPVEEKDVGSYIYDF